MLDLLARIEVTVDYPEEDIESMLEDEVRSRLMSARENAGSCWSRPTREG